MPRPGDKLLVASQTRAGLYLEAHDVPAFSAQQGGSDKVMFLDLRTRAEAMLVGVACAWQVTAGPACTRSSTA